MLPAQQGLDADQLGLVAVQLADRLVHQAQLAARTGLGEGALQFQLALRLLLQLVAVAGELGLARALGAV